MIGPEPRRPIKPSWPRPRTPATAQAAKARLARFRGDWAGAYRHFAAALRENPQDLELLNELEQVREQMRPALAARNLPSVWRGQRRPEETYAPLAVRPL